MAKKIIPPVNGFTTTFLNNLKPQNKPYEVGDKGCKGLRIKISNTGSKAFLTTIRIDSKRKVFTLGYYPNLSLSDARKTLLQMKSGARNGKLITDKERKQQQETERLALEAQKKANTITLGEVLKDFINTVIDKRRAPNPPKSLLNAHIFSHELASAPIRTVTKTDIKALIFNLRKDREPSAIELFYLLKQFLNWAERQGQIDKSPINTNDRSDWKLIKQPKKDKALDIDDNGVPVAGLPQIKQFIRSLDTKHKPVPTLALKILLLTGARTGELRKALKKHVNLEEKIWFIPKENTKSWRPEKNIDTSITIPLSHYACQIFQQLMETSCTEFVADIRHALLPTNVQRVVKRHNFHYFTVHTLRKTLRSHVITWARFEVAEKCLNHSLGQIAGIYDHGSLFNERREALNIWSDKVYRACYGSETNVVQLRG